MTVWKRTCFTNVPPRSRARKMNAGGGACVLLVSQVRKRRLCGHGKLCELAIRIWPKIEIDELVFCLPEKKWMSICVHWAHLAACGHLGP